MKRIIVNIVFVFTIFSSFAIQGKIITTLDYSFPDKWYYTMSETTQGVSTINKVYKKQYFLLFPFFIDFAVDSQNNCNINYDLKIIKPDGEIFFEKNNIVALNKKITNKTNVMISQGMMKICFENEDDFGNYRILIILKDLVEKKDIKLVSKIKVIKNKYGKTRFNDKTYNEFYQKYYETPEPDKAIDSYIYFANSKYSEKDSSFIPVLKFYMNIFNNNEYLIPEIYEIFDKQSDRAKVYLIYLLRYLNYDSKDFLISLKDKEKQIYDYIKDQDIPIITDENEISEIIQLDILWADFFSNGSYSPVKRLVDTLKYAEYSGFFDKYNTSSKAEIDLSEAMKDAIYQATVWSLTKNYNNHRLVHDYCDFIYNYEKLNETAKKELGKIIKK